MKTIIYYFTGTGNSLAVAQGLSSRLGDCELVSIASRAGTPGQITPQADRVGIVCPVYFFGLPALVATFTGRVNLSGTGYTFAALTMGGSGGSAALRQLDEILRRGPAGRGLDATFTVRMPGNYILMYGSPGLQEQEEILAQAHHRVAEIADTVNRMLPVRLPGSTVASLIHRLMYPRFIARVHGSDEKFTVDDRCTSCGTCVDVCPVRNIDLVAGRPVWQHRCEQCMACIHLCPTEAIQAGPKTEKRRRYHHPAVHAETLKGQRRE